MILVGIGPLAGAVAVVVAYGWDEGAGAETGGRSQLER